MARKREKRGSKKASKAALTTQRIQTWKLAVELTALEMAAGHDGLLRGAPEPVVLLGAYFVTSAGAPRVRPLGRELVRFIPEGRFPLVVAPPSRSVLKGRARGVDGDRLIVVAIALEEDGGKDVERLYAHLSEAARLRFWEVDALEPAPATIAELAASPPSPPPFSARVHVLDDSMDLRDSCESDKLIGAGIVVLKPNRSEEGFRVQFVSVDRRNDWTAILAVTIG